MWRAVSVSGRLDVNVALNRTSYMSTTKGVLLAKYANDGFNATDITQFFHNDWIWSTTSFNLRGGALKIAPLLVLQYLNQFFASCYLNEFVTKVTKRCKNVTNKSKVSRIEFPCFTFHAFFSFLTTFRLSIFLPNVIKIDPYNFELYRFKVGALFRHNVVYNNVGLIS